MTVATQQKSKQSWVSKDREHAKHEMHNGPVFRKGATVNITLVNVIAYP